MKVDKTTADFYLYKIRKYIDSNSYKSTHEDVVTRKGRTFSLRGFNQYLRMTTITQPDEMYFLRNLIEIFKELYPIVKSDHSIIDQYYWWTIRNTNQTLDKLR